MRRHVTILNLDGIRALAVLMVILYHVRPNLCPGGYVGVDIFFVLSGYLITQKIQKELNENRFSYIQFLAGRIKRLYPMFFLVAVSTSLLSLSLFQASDLIRYSKSLLSSLAYVSNIFFYLESGYFDVGSEYKPLLHTWSLSLEEQFYILFPFLLIFLSKCKPYANPLTRLNPILTMAAFAGVSLVGCIYITPLDPSLTFYILPFRVWELLFGGILSQIKVQKTQGAALPWRFMCPMGGLLIFIGALLAKEVSAFPGWYCLFPVVGTCLLVLYTHVQQQPIRIFENTIARMLGQSSYASYLIHWPAVVLSKQFLFISEFNDRQTVGLLVVIFTLSWALTRHVEQPIRNKPLTTKSIFLLFLGSNLVLIAVATGTIFFAQAKATKADSREVSQLTKQISKVKKDTCHQLDRKICTIQNAQLKGDPEIVIWGDSYASELGNYLSTLTRKKIMTISILGCPPIIDTSRSDPYADEFCNVRTQATVMQYLLSHPPQTLVLVARWNMYVDGYRIKGVLRKETHYLQPSDSTSLDSSQDPAAISKETLRENLRKTIERLKSIHHLFVIRPTPELKERGEILSNKPEVEYLPILKTRQEHVASSHFINQIFDTLENEKKVRSIDLTNSYCTQDICNFRDETDLFYFDETHLTLYGLAKSMPLFLPILE